MDPSGSGHKPPPHMYLQWFLPKNKEKKISFDLTTLLAHSECFWKVFVFCFIIQVDMSAWSLSGQTV